MQCTTKHDDYLRPELNKENALVLLEHEITAKDKDKVGTKSANLGEDLRIFHNRPYDMRIPTFGSTTVRAYRLHERENIIPKKVLEEVLLQTGQSDCELFRHVQEKGNSSNEIVAVRSRFRITNDAQLLKAIRRLFPKKPVEEIFEKTGMPVKELGEYIENAKHPGTPVLSGDIMTDILTQVSPSGMSFEQLKCIILNEPKLRQVTHQNRQIDLRGDITRRLMCYTTLSDEFIGKLRLVFDYIRSICGEDITLVTRSSNATEDLGAEELSAIREKYRLPEEAIALLQRRSREEGSSSAGMQASIMNIPLNMDAMKLGVRDCYESAWTDRAVNNRENNGIPHEAVALAVTIQRQGMSKASNVIMTIDRVSGNDRVISITSMWGQGEKLVQGKGKAAETMFSKEMLKEWAEGRAQSAIIFQRIHDQRDKLIARVHEAGLTTSPLNREERNSFPFTDDELHRYALASLEVEEHFSRLKGAYTAMDLEGFKEEDSSGKDMLYITQSREETVKSAVIREGRDRIITRINIENAEKLQPVLSGQVGGPGVGIGPCLIVPPDMKVGSSAFKAYMNRAKTHYRESGEPVGLLAFTTMPELEPWMADNRENYFAAYIISVEGNTKCHAALIAGEYKIPCIVGCGNRLVFRKRKHGNGNISEYAEVFSNKGELVRIDNFEPLSVFNEGAQSHVVKGKVNFSVHEIDNATLPPVYQTKNTQIHANPHLALSDCKITPEVMTEVGLHRMEFALGKDELEANALLYANFDFHLLQAEKVLKAFSSDYNHVANAFAGELARFFGYEELHSVKINYEGRHINPRFNGNYIEVVKAAYSDSPDSELARAVLSKLTEYMTERNRAVAELVSRLQKMRMTHGDDFSGAIPDLNTCTEEERRLLSLYRMYLDIEIVDNSAERIAFDPEVYARISEISKKYGIAAGDLDEVTILEKLAGQLNMPLRSTDDIPDEQLKQEIENQLMDIEQYRRRDFWEQHSSTFEKAREETVKKSKSAVYPELRSAAEYGLYEIENVELVKEKARGYAHPIDYFIDTYGRNIVFMASLYSQVTVREIDLKMGEMLGSPGGFDYNIFPERPVRNNSPDTYLLPQLPDLSCAEKEDMTGRRGTHLLYQNWFTPALEMILEAKRRVSNISPTIRKRVRTMFPVVRTLQEFVHMTHLYRNAGLDHPLGMMGEIPANMENAILFFRDADFMSLGSNDLNQFLFLLSRNDNPDIIGDTSELNFQMLKSIIKVATTAKSLHKYIGSCGNAPTQYPDLLKILILLGFDSVSIMPHTSPDAQQTQAELQDEIVREFPDIDITRRFDNATRHRIIQTMLERYLTNSLVSQAESIAKNTIYKKSNTGDILELLVRDTMRAYHIAREEVRIFKKKMKKPDYGDSYLASYMDTTSSRTKGGIQTTDPAVKCSEHSPNIAFSSEKVIIEQIAIHPMALAHYPSIHEHYLALVAEGTDWEELERIVSLAEGLPKSYQRSDEYADAATKLAYKRVIDKFNEIRHEGEGPKELFSRVYLDALESVWENAKNAQVTITLCNLNSADLFTLPGGYLFEHEEDLPSMGQTGSSRLLWKNFREAFLLEVNQLSKFINNHHNSREQIKVAIPMVRSLDEVLAIIRILQDTYVMTETEFRLGVDISVPANLEAIELMRKLGGVKVIILDANHLMNAFMALNPHDTLNLLGRNDLGNVALIRAFFRAIVEAKKNDMEIEIKGSFTRKHKDLLTMFILLGTNIVHISPDNSMGYPDLDDIAMTGLETEDISKKKYLERILNAVDQRRRSSFVKSVIETTRLKIRYESKIDLFNRSLREFLTPEAREYALEKGEEVESVLNRMIAHVKAGLITILRTPGLDER
jgi:phosphoenolpyruvate synthase/pyruvate phosphate dikinase